MYFGIWRLWLSFLNIFCLFLVVDEIFVGGESTSYQKMDLYEPGQLNANIRSRAEERDHVPRNTDIRTPEW